MGKQSRRSSRRYSKAKLPPWFNVSFDKPTSWATIRIPEDNTSQVLSNLYTIIDSPFWAHVLTLQANLTQLIEHKDWSTVSSPDLVQMLQVVGDIRVGINSFLPPPFHQLPFEVRRELHLALFVLHGVADFLINPFPDVPAWVRSSGWGVLMPAGRVLWYEVARDAMLTTIQTAIASGRIADAAKLAILLENEQRAVDVWLPLLGTNPETLVREMIPDALNWQWTGKKGSAHPTMTDLFLAVQPLLKNRSAAEILVEAIMGDLGKPFHQVVDQNLKDLAKQDARQKLPGETSILRGVERDDGTFELTVEEAVASHYSSPLDELIDRETPLTEEQKCGRALPHPASRR